MAQRSKDAPMDWQYTSRPEMKPVWSSSSNDNVNPSTPRKRPFQQLSQTTPSVPTFGTNQNVPFMFNQPPTPSNPQHPWAPPPHFSPTKAFPTTPSQPEVVDVEMTEPSPPKVDTAPTESKRAVAAGAMRRVFKSRQRQKQSKTSVTRSAHHSDEESEVDDDDTDDESHGAMVRNTRPSTNHYTLNMGSPNSDLPSVLLGYLQFGFNLFLVLVFLYLLVQFILTVQRDLDQRITEYSLDIVHDIATCAMHYNENHCDNPYPALAKQCKEWQVCMNRDPTIVGRARVGAELIAEVVNGFVEPISWKTLGFTLTSLSFLTLFINTVLSMYKSRHSQGSPAPMPPLAPPIYVEPYHTSGRPVRWSRAWQGREEPETPARRRRLEGGVAKIS